MRRFIFFIVASLITPLAFSQDYADEMNKLKGNPIKVELKFKKGFLHYNSNWHYLYTFFDSGKIKNQQNYERGKLRAEYHYEYDSKGNKISEKFISIVNQKDSSEIFKTEYTFDDHGNIKTEILKFHDNKIMWLRDSIVYNNSNLPLKYIKVYPPSAENGQTIIEYFTLKYNDLGLADEINMNEKDGSSNKTCYWYYDNGDISKSDVTLVVALKSNTRLALSNNKFTGNKVVEYSYKYDKHANWIKRYTSVNNSKKKLELRRLIRYN